jgi:hypothetical protein
MFGTKAVDKNETHILCPLYLFHKSYDYKDKQEERYAFLNLYVQQ